ncbi:MAG: hypothetical protein GWN99_01365 [Gemmatimonadetes bacterium]|uniref:TolB N-terminal domain-containing protein n=1 Tax=Candidatus Kutchimonas denitrificans TaxID=3056748 RepID=A0AAE4Z523_9BACT|nr:hypothetical protein [Gemmatimonadota bacterium]NIR73910.1 hypothetical protein [Candidatus Kutchimonas denitrificans]NIR99716.1 hypothetical protein [Gemmatimonadota bacterium]NIT65301.1 hypothetical protein [Gemmatimonadota bacterium]NIW73750.1 hypothetical protein [Gemmatimonadota bacterium]
MIRETKYLLSWPVVFALIAAAPASLSAQERDSIPSDVRVGILYQPAFRPGIAMPAVSAPEGLEELADSVRTIILRDFDYSDRLQPLERGADMPQQGPVNYALWDELGAVWLLIGVIEGSADAPILRLSLHDVVFKLVQDVRAFDLRPLAHPDGRMAIHRAADQVMEWATNSPGIAATRIAYVGPGRGGSEIFTVDSDGFGARPITNDSSIALSPAWAPSGDRLAFMSYRRSDPAILELDLAHGTSRVLVDLPGMDMTPTYSPDGSSLAFGAYVDGRTEIYVYDLLRGCCPERVTFARFANSLSPTFAPDSRRIAFNSDRLGQLHIFVSSIGDSSPELLTPYIYDRSVHNAAPDWSPQGDRIVFHGWVANVPQLFTVAPNGRGLRQLTQVGRNEDPSWAIDGRHVVFHSTRAGTAGLWVLDVVTGRVRKLVGGFDVRLPDWSGRIDSPSRSGERSSDSVNDNNQ